MFSLVFVDFLYYIWHRLAHKVNLLWATHAVHHSPKHLNFWNGTRSSFIEKILFCMFLFVPISLLDFTGLELIKSLTIILTFQWWVHCSWFPKLKILDFIFNTPSNHRVHHQIEHLRRGKNFGGLFIVFDRFFGTYQEETLNEPHTYGLLNRKEVYNVIQIEIYEIVALFKKGLSAKSFNMPAGIIFKEPGWRSDRRQTLIAVTTCYYDLRLLLNNGPIVSREALDFQWNSFLSR